VVEAALTGSATAPAPARWKTPAAAAALIGCLLVLVISGEWPELRSKLPFTPKGLVAIAPGQIERIEIRESAESIALRRQVGGWAIDDADGAAPAELASHVDTALKFASVSEPTRAIPGAELTSDSFAVFGLDPPSLVAVLETHAGVAATVNFGTPNPAGTSHYVRLGGAPTVYLMPRHVTEEWQLVFDMARRLKGKASTAVASRSADLLLPVSMAQVGAIEIVTSGKLTRFERDPAGLWFRHLGQHTHAAGSNVHVADPAQAPIIDAAFRAFDAAVAETRVGPGDTAHLTQYGLALPTLIVLFYARDSSTPLTRLEFGVSADELDRYARLAPDGPVVTVAEFEPRRLIELLKAVGAGS
jgi:acylphosphatase